MSLDKNTLELVAIGASVAACCEPCLEFHVKAAREAGATPAEICKAIKMAEKVRQVPIDKMNRKCEKLNLGD
jgi:AhpD family alkylhydroperoxidase